MAIAGLLVHTLSDKVKSVEEEIRVLPGMTTYGIHEDQYIVVVAEADADHMEKAVEKIDDIDGVLTIYTTYLTIEDELADEPDKVFKAPRGKTRK